MYLKNIVVTGTTSGIGYAIVKALAARGDHVVAVTLNDALGSKAYQSLGSPQNVSFVSIDLSSNQAIEKGSHKIKALFSNQKIDVLIHCAAIVPQYYITNEQGYEMQFQVNHLAIMNLTLNLLDYIKRAEGIVIATSSRVHRSATINFDDLMLRKKYFLFSAYKKSKLANVLFAYEFNRRYSKDHVLAYLVDPRLVNTRIAETNTRGIIRLFWSIRRRFGQDPNAVASYFLQLIDQEKNDQEPYYYKYGKQVEPSNYGKDEQIAKRFWEASEKLIK